MPRLTALARLAALALALVFPMLAWVAPANAADPTPVVVTLRAEPDLEEDTTIELAGRVSPTATGTYTYRDADGNVIATGPALANGGTYPVHVPKPAGPTTFTVDFDSDTDEYADGTGTLNWVPKNVKTVTATPQPTVLKISGLVPTLTLTLATTFKLKDGTGVAGIEVYNYTLCDPGPQRDCALHVPICRAVSDANGLATCKGQGTLGAVVSLLGPNAIQFFYTDTKDRGYHYAWNPTTYPIVA